MSPLLVLGCSGSQAMLDGGGFGPAEPLESHVGEHRKDLKAVLDEVQSWPAEERLRLLGEIWDGISSAPEAATLTEAQQRDLQRRLDAYRDNPKAGSPWEEVKARLQGDVR